MAKNKLLKINWPGLEIGVASYPEGPTGCTVLHFPKGAIGAVDIRGGAAAVRESSSLCPLNASGWVDAIVLAGGSTYGLEAADGVAQEILRLRKNAVNFAAIPAVPAAIVYDFAGRDNAIYPDKELGAKAFRARKTGLVPYGAVGAGTHVTVGKYFGRAYAEPGGQGAAVFAKGNLRLLALSAVNAVGNIYDEKGRILAGSRSGRKRLGIEEILKEKKGKKVPVPKGNTTVSVIATNIKLDRPALQRLAVMAHTAMAQSIRPFHTPDDGDVLFAVSTNEKSLPVSYTESDLCVLAGSLANQAVRSLF